MPRIQSRFLLALLFSLGIHAALLASRGTIDFPPPLPPQPLQVRLLQTPLPENRVIENKEKTQPRQTIRDRNPAIVQPVPMAMETIENPSASMVVPPAPSAEEWAIASTYTLRNSKRYRHNWGQLVRSMMGPAVSGPDQGQVRFRIEIAPDGKVAKVEEIWSTSEVASRLAKAAIQALPPLPPTPTGQPLIFERTISFLPFETGWPPSYKLDCLPEPERFNNPFASDGVSNKPPVQRTHRPPIPDDCVIDSTAETIEEEERELKRQMDQWRWAR